MKIFNISFLCSTHRKYFSGYFLKLVKNLGITYRTTYYVRKENLDQTKKHYSASEEAK